MFGLGGGHINPTWWAVRDDPDMTLVDVRHEGAAVYAAEGWALATREPGVCLVTAAPGITNALTGLANARANGAPLVCIAGASTLRGQDTGEVESLDQLELARQVTKWAGACITSTGSPSTSTWRSARRGRAGPDRCTSRSPSTSSTRSSTTPTSSSPPASTRSAAGAAPRPSSSTGRSALLEGAARPALVVGSGVWWADADEELRAFVERAGIPVVTRQAARGIIPDDHPLCFGQDWQNVCYQADVLLCVGKQLDYFFGYGRFPNLDHFIQVDVNPLEIGRNRVPVSVGIVADARAALGQLTDAIQPLRGRRLAGPPRRPGRDDRRRAGHDGELRAGPDAPDAALPRAPSAARP